MMPKKWLVGLAAALLMVLSFSCAWAAEAVDLTNECSFHLSYTKKSEQSMIDRKSTTTWESHKDNNPWVEIVAPAGVPIQGLYICFATMPDSYEIQVDNGNGWETVKQGDTRFYHTYVSLAPAQRVRIYVTDEKLFQLAINEIYAFSEGDLPDWVQRWEPTVEKADMMFLIAHPGDEQLYFGGAIPTYVAEQQRRVVIAYLSDGSNARRTELLNGLWAMGVRNYPVIGDFREASSNTAAKAYKTLGRAYVMEYIVDLYRRYQPEVVVTHDAMGENKNGQHMMLADAAQTAIEKAMTDGEYLDSYMAFGLWQVKKLYLHLHEENQIVFDWSVPLESFGGKTSLEVATEAFGQHAVQIKNKRSMESNGVKYDNRVFGLVHTTVGEDVRKDDFLENIYEPKSYVPIPTAPPPTPEPTPIPAYVSKLPQLNEKGFLDEGEFIYSSEEEGMWIFVDQTAKIVINRKYDASVPLTWFEAEIWSDVEAGELLKTVQYDAEKMGRVRADAQETAKKHGLVFAMNTDYYTYRLGDKRKAGVVVRDGKVLYDERYSEKQVNKWVFPNLDTLAFYPDGRLEVYHSFELSAQEYVDKGAYAVYSFGPYLVKDGQFSERVFTSNDSRNPRCAIGMVEPGHYVAVLAEGRLGHSKGITMTHLGKLMRAKGCQVAFNLDGGNTAVMVFMGKQLNEIAKAYGSTKARATSEVMAIGHSDQVGIYEVK
ncbi:MAG: phosphodiester glycosidase family protein [Clostridia bacterium]|nr:phosphodiester glycosidase family protein [Clostridia bacterium]